MPKYTEEQIKKVLEERESERVTLLCSKHNYVASKIPPSTHGCKECWYAYYVYDIASTPPHMRKERLNELESVIKHAVEFEQSGKFGKDFELYGPGDSRFEVSYERDAYPDKEEK